MDPDKAPNAIAELAGLFLENKQHFQSANYNEAETRAEFVNPVFAALGWDMYNTSGYSSAYKDVVVEYSLKVGASHKAPDYSFRVGGTRKFFVEAKRPATDITKESAPAYQLRRYAWTAKLSVSVLTNFRHLAVYDCTIRPSETDKPSTARTLLVPVEDLVERWSDIASLLSKESVYQGRLDRYAAEASRRRGTTEVDDAFLKQMEHWRLTLARNLALRNKSLSVADLNDAVQRTIDRLVFLRIAEDRGIERYGTLSDAVPGTSVYSRILEVFASADNRYNSGLFHFKQIKGSVGPPDTLTPTLTIDDLVLRDIVRSMYYPRSPYEFSVLPADILGQVYEQFLGKVITLSPGRRAELEPKPEVSKAGGVYYTPTTVVDHIVERTVGQALAGKTPRQALNVRIVDPACGSGSFLLGAYEYLLRWFTTAYTEAGAVAQKKHLYQTARGEWRPTLDERKRILTSCIYGVDIDRQAVEVTKLSLLLKVLEGESEETLNSQLSFFHMSRVLPDLDSNITCGNSLVGSDVLDALVISEEEEDALNPFDWDLAFPKITKAGGFDCVIGNPPYDVLEKERGAASWPHAILREYLDSTNTYESALGGKLNLYRLFLVRSLKLTRQGGHLGMIVPLSVAGDISTAPTRDRLFGELRGAQIDCFPQKDNPSRRIFKRAKLSTAVVTGQADGRGKGPRPAIDVRVYPANSFNDTPLINSVTLTECAVVDPVARPIPMTDAAQWRLCVDLHEREDVNRLGQVEDYEVTRGEINQTIYRAYIGADSNQSRLLKGVEVGAFRLRESLSQGQREWLDADRFHMDYPRRSTPPRNRIATQRITGVDERARIVAAVVDGAVYFADSTNSITATDEGSLDFLCALLNSDLFQWRFRLTSSNNNVGTNELEALPIRTATDSSHRATVVRLEEMTRRLNELNDKLGRENSSSGASQLMRKIVATSRRLNEAVFDLYGLSQEERRLVGDELRRFEHDAASDE